MTWSIVGKTEDEKTRLQALALINDVNKYRTELVTNGVIVHDSLQIIQSKVEHLNGVRETIDTRYQGRFYFLTRIRTRERRPTTNYQRRILNDLSMIWCIIKFKVAVGFTDVFYFNIGPHVHVVSVNETSIITVHRTVRQAQLHRQNMDLLVLLVPTLGALPILLLGLLLLLRLLPSRQLSCLESLKR